MRNIREQEDPHPPHLSTEQPIRTRRRAEAVALTYLPIHPHPQRLPPAVSFIGGSNSLPCLS